IPRAITRASQCRYADATVDVIRNRLICVREDHGRADGVVTNSIVAIDLDEIKSEQVLVQGHDFYSNPRISLDGRRLSWLAWNQPNMPWIGTELWMGMIGESGEILAPIQIAGSAEESVFQPEWSPSGALYFISDRSGWWNLYRHREEGAIVVLEKKAEFGQPQWVFGMATYGFRSDGCMICSYRETGRSHIAIFSESSEQLIPLDLPYT